MKRFTRHKIWATFFLLAVLVHPFSGSSAGGNGTDRGGGDEYVAEFQDVKRSMLATLESRIQKGEWASNPALDRFLREAGTIPIYSLDQFPAHVAPDARDVSLVDRSTSPATLVFQRSTWRYLKSIHLRCELEAAIITSLAKALRIDGSSWSRKYLDLGMREITWKQTKAATIEIALRSYVAASRFYESQPYLIFEATLRTQFARSDFERCTRRGTYAKTRGREQTEACRSWLSSFWNQVEKDSEILRVTLSDVISENSQKITHSWLASQHDTYLSSVREGVVASFAPLSNLRRDADIACGSGTSLPALAECLETFRVRKHAESEAALAASLTSLDQSFQALSEKLSLQVEPRE